MDLKQVWFSGVHSDIGGSYGPDKKMAAEVSDIALSWMLREAAKAGLKIEPHIKAVLTDGRKAPLHRSRNHVYRLKRRLHRSLQVEGKALAIHVSVKDRYLSDSKYRPKRLVTLVNDVGWDHMMVEV